MKGHRRSEHGHVTHVHVGTTELDKAFKTISGPHMQAPDSCRHNVFMGTSWTRRVARMWKLIGDMVWYFVESWWTFDVYVNTCLEIWLVLGLF